MNLCLRRRRRALKQHRSGWNRRLGASCQQANASAPQQRVSGHCHRCLGYFTPPLFTVLWPALLTGCHPEINPAALPCRTWKTSASSRTFSLFHRLPLSRVSSISCLVPRATPQSSHARPTNGSHFHLLVIITAVIMWIEPCDIFKTISGQKNLFIVIKYALPVIHWLFFPS